MKKERYKLNGNKKFNLSNQVMKAIVKLERNERRILIIENINFPSPLPFKNFMQTKV
jgi:hypothetical protein